MNLPVKQLIRLADCLKCYDICCHFLKSGIDATPVLTEDELALIKKKYKGPFSVRQWGKSGRVFQICLKKIRNKNIYICPFLERSDQRCKINGIKPFDCRFWPFLLIRSKDKKSIHIAYFDKTICPALKNISRNDFEKYKKYAIGLFRKKKYLDFIKQHPEIVYSFDEDAKFINKLEI